LFVTDGISEVPNADDEESGLDRLEELIRKNASRPLAELWELIMDDVNRHGVQQDDQTLLLLRVLAQRAWVAGRMRVTVDIMTLPD
jgi:serine phosphatase RsbU (regulator of sigma subunit)